MSNINISTRDNFHRDDEGYIGVVDTSSQTVETTEGLEKVISRLSQVSATNNNHSSNNHDLEGSSSTRRVEFYAPYSSAIQPMENVHEHEHEHDVQYSGRGKMSRMNSEEFTESTVEQNNSSSLDVDGVSYPEGGKHAWRVVLGSFLGLVTCFGLPNSLGAIQAYVETHQLKEYSSSKVGWIFSIYLFLMFFFSIQAGPLFDAYGPYHIVLAGTVIYVTCIMLTSICTEYYQFVLAFGVGCGIGTSMLFTPLIAIVGHWFNYKRGLATGLASMGGSIGGIIFPLMLRNLYSKVGYGWAIRIFGFVSLSLLLSSLLLIKTRLQKSEELKLRPKDIFDIRSLKDLRYTFLIVAVFLLELALLDGVTYLTSYCLAQGMSTSKSYLMLTLYNVAGVPGRWSSGWAADKFGRFNTMVGFAALSTIVIFVVWLPFGHSFGTMILFTLLYGFSTGTVMSVTPVCCGQICKTEDYGKRYGMMYLFSSFSVLFGIPLSGLLINDKNYDYLVAFCGAVYFGAFAFLVLSRYACVGLKVFIKV